jgi:hypothetical protein
MPGSIIALSVITARAASLDSLLDRRRQVDDGLERGERQDEPAVDEQRQDDAREHRGVQQGHRPRLRCSKSSARAGGGGAQKRSATKLTS